MRTADCKDLTGEAIAAALAAMDDLTELSRAWGSAWDIRQIGGEWHAISRHAGPALRAVIITGTAAGMWLALWEARDALRHAA